MESFQTAAWPFAGQDIRSLLEWRREASRDRTFLVWAPFDGEERTWTYGAFVDWVERFAAGLGARGVRPGDRVLVHMENSPEFLVAWLGCAAAGVVAVTTNARSSPEEMKYYCGDAAPSPPSRNRNSPRWSRRRAGTSPGSPRPRQTPSRRRPTLGREAIDSTPYQRIPLPPRLGRAIPARRSPCSTHRGPPPDPRASFGPTPMRFGALASARRTKTCAGTTYT